jgi:hypothetical protein
MAHLSASGTFGNNGSAYDGKCNSAREKREAKVTENRHLKHSMDAYYRPRLRGLIQVDVFDVDDTDAMTSRKHTAYDRHRL